MENLLKSLPDKDARESTFFEQNLSIFGRFFGHFGSMLGPRREKTQKNTLLESKRKKDEKKHEKPRKRDPTRGAQAIKPELAGERKAQSRKRQTKSVIKQIRQRNKMRKASEQQKMSTNKQNKKRELQKHFFPNLGPECPQNRGKLA